MTKINLILDIDETLVHTKKIEEKDFLNNKDLNNKNIINLPNFIGVVYLRPFLEKFLYFCFENFNVSFWTTSNSLYCKTILKLILTKEQYENTQLILSSEENQQYRWHTDLVNISNSYLDSFGSSKNAREVQKIRDYSRTFIDRF